MLLLSIFQHKKLNYVVLFLAFSVIGNAETNTNVTSKAQQVGKETPVVVPEQKSVKKELKVNLTDTAIVAITPAHKEDDHTEKLVVMNDKSVLESSSKALEQQQIPKSGEKTSLLETATTNLNSLIFQRHHSHKDEDFVLNDENDISESLRTGFYFFLIVSSAAMVFIVFKIYRLRLSRVERKYGVQGDRSNQELTPLPISIEDGHSDDEDQTLYEIQRQNIRIL